MDQTPIRVVFPAKKTVSPRGVKQVSIDSHFSITNVVSYASVTDMLVFQVIMKNPPGDKKCFTINLTVKADGTKLPAQVIFKTAAKGGQLSDDFLQKLNAPPNIEVMSAPKAWWSRKFDDLYVSNLFPKVQEETVLLRDCFAVHLMEEIVNRLEALNVHQIVIPPGMTGELQPLDVGINKPFKDYVREEYRKWRLENMSFTAKGYIRKPEKKDFLQFVSRAWYKVTDTVVQNSFYAAQILDRDRPLPKVGGIVEVEDKDLNASIIDETDFLDADECEASSEEDSDFKTSSECERSDED